MDQQNITKEYTNGEVTVVWKPGLCMHSKICFNGLPEVFDPEARPWVNMDGAETDRIVQQVKKCPSGALSYFMNDSNQEIETQMAEKEMMEVEVIPDGPLIIKGQLRVRMPDGAEKIQERSTALCRCGASGNKPFCDGSHQKIEFKG